MLFLKEKESYIADIVLYKQNKNTTELLKLTDTSNRIKFGKMN